MNVEDAEAAAEEEEESQVEVEGTVNERFLLLCQIFTYSLGSRSIF